MSLAILGLSKKQEKVLLAVQEGVNTPLLLARALKLSRTNVYAILLNLKKRGLVGSRIIDGKKYWNINTAKELEESIYEAKKSLLQLSIGSQEVYGLADSMVLIHRGKDAIKKAMSEMFAGHKNERFYSFQGDIAADNWNKVFSLNETNKFNELVKKNSIITEGIINEHWFERQAELLGPEWVKEFEGRMTRTVLIDEKYFNHGGQLFIFKNSIYLLALGEELIIEMRHSEIQKLILSFFKFIQERGKLIDANALLRTLIG